MKTKFLQFESQKSEGPGHLKYKYFIIFVLGSSNHYDDIDDTLITLETCEIKP